MKRKKKKQNLFNFAWHFSRSINSFFHKKKYISYGKLDKVKYITRELTFETIKGYNPFREIGIKFFLE